MTATLKQTGSDNNLTKTQAQWRLIAIMLVSLMGSAGIALPYPILSPWFLDTANNITRYGGIDPKMLLGFVLAIYPLGLLLGSVVIGALSDKYGRKKVLTLTLLASVLGYLLSAAAIVMDSFWGFVLARLVTGFFEGNIAIARALALDLHPVIDRRRSLALLYATGYAGWLVGPLAGGYLMIFGVATSFLVAGAAVMLSLLMVWLTISHQPPQLERSPLTLWQEIRRNHSATLLRNPAVGWLAVYYAVYTLGINAYYEYYPLWLVESHQFDSRAIGWATVSITTVMIVISSTVAHRLPAIFGERKTLFLSTIGFGAAIIVATQLQGLWFYLPLAATGGFIALINTVYPTIMSHHFGHLGEGKVVGLQVSIFCFTNVVIALIGGWVSTFGSLYTMWLASVLIFASLFLFRTPDESNDDEFNPGESSPDKPKYAGLQKAASDTPDQTIIDSKIKEEAS